MSTGPLARRVVITGMGMVSPLGRGTELAWRRLLSGASGLSRLPEDLAPDVPGQVAGQVPDLARDPEGGWDIDAVVSPRTSARWTASFRWHWTLRTRPWPRPAGSRPASRSARARPASLARASAALAPLPRPCAPRTAGVSRLSPFTVPSFLVNLAAGHVSIRHGLKGPLGAPVTACAASVQALGDGLRMIRSGEADVALCGGAEAAIDRVSLGAFAAAKALSTGYNDRPEEASRPFDAGRDGFVMGEGAGALVLEGLDHALARGAVPLAEVVGYGTSADAYHITSGPEDGDGARRSMAQALAMAGLSPDQLQYLNAHATSTPVGDRGELAAMRSLFGEGSGVAISSTKSATGHLLGAAGAVAAIFTVLALRDQMAPATRNLVEPDPLAQGLDLIAGAARPWAMEHALVNGFGFGGVNASLVLRRWQG